MEGGVYNGIFLLVMSQTQTCLLSYIDFHVLSGNSNGNLA